MNVRTIFRVFLALIFMLGIPSAVNSTQASAATGLTTALSSAVTPDPANPRFLSYNVCGGVCPVYQNSVTTWRDTLINAIDNWDADVVMLQEVCYGQWIHLRNTLQARAGGDQYDSVWHATRTYGGCGNGKWGTWAGSAETEDLFGLVILVKGSEPTITDRQVHKLPNPAAGEERALLCGLAPVKGRVTRVCNTHIDFKAESFMDGKWSYSNPRTQVEAVDYKMDQYAAAGEPIILGGDFNPPVKQTADESATKYTPNLSPLYHTGHTDGTGIFQEVDETDTNYFIKNNAQDQAVCAGKSVCRSGEPTADTCSTQNDQFVPIKLDFIFVSPQFTSVYGDSAACTQGVSDHRLLRGEAAWAS
ncbi:endonuclease/exonuclease/phosphatase family protein [Streptomyces sp. NPDC007818]|uniref:endonuclease/exonuclease/phosphatase family protein n=1 Tax=Streptomyces sp. NPDC007818 TaxID=3364780 RepID=UPI003689B996